MIKPHVQLAAFVPVGGTKHRRGELIKKKKLTGKEQREPRDLG